MSVVDASMTSNAGAGASAYHDGGDRAAARPGEGDMTRTIFYTATTLDGFLADERDSLDWLLSQPLEPGMSEAMEAFTKGAGALVMGATTYEWVIAHGLGEGGAWPYAQPTWVFTHRDDLPRIEGDIRFVAGDVAGIHPELVSAAGERDVWVVGGGDLAAQFAAAGLLDEIEATIAPVVLGGGRPLFTRAFDLELLEASRSGVFVSTRYRVLGPRGARTVPAR